MPLFVITAYPEEVTPGNVAGVFSKPFDTSALIGALEQAHAERRSPS
jgi:hypothetical protein